MGVVVGLLILVAACAGPSVHHSGSGAVRLVAAAGELRAECTVAAATLGFAVPCPTEVPQVKGRPLSCPTHSNAKLPPCIGLAGLPPSEDFFIDFAGFDVDPSYVGVDGKAYGHVIITATRQSEGPAQPCIGKRVGTFRLTHGGVVKYRCSNDALLVQRDARHGEGAQLGHLLLAWNQDGIGYTASAHGYSEVNLTLLRQLVGSMILVRSR